MRRIFFFFREGFSAVSRAGLAGWLSVLAFAILTALISSAWIANQVLDNVSERLLAMFELEAFIKPGMEKRLDKLVEEIRARDAVTQVVVITPEDARERFAAEFGDELFGLLDENPLPSSILVRYDPSRVTFEMLEAEQEVLAALPEVEEVAFEGELLKKVESFASVIRNRFMVLVLVMAAIVLFFSYQSTRVAVKASKSWMKAVALVGGSPAQLGLPFLIAGLLTSGAGGFIGTGSVCLIQMVLAQGESFVPSPEFLPYVYVWTASVLTGITTSYLSTPRDRSRL